MEKMIRLKGDSKVIVLTEKEMRLNRLQVGDLVEVKLIKRNLIETGTSLEEAFK